MREALAQADHDYVIAEPRRRPRRRGRLAEAAARGGRVLDRAAKYLSLVAGAALAAVVVGILVNALALQKTRHPAPFFGHTVPVTEAAAPPAAVPAPATRPVPDAPDPAPASEPAARGHVADPAEPSAPPRDPIGQMLKAFPPARPPLAPAKPEGPKAVQVKSEAARSEPAKSEPVKSDPIKSELAKTEQGREATRTVAAAQRALVKLGFVLRADGVMGASTHQAIEQFERDRGLPVHGELSPRLLRVLAAESGLAIE